MKYADDGKKNITTIHWNSTEITVLSIMRTTYFS